MRGAATGIAGVRRALEGRRRARGPRLGGRQTGERGEGAREVRGGRVVGSPHEEGGRGGPGDGGAAGRGFSLVEVVLALGVLAVTMVAVAGLLGSMGAEVRSVRDRRVATQLPSPLREEMNRLGFAAFVEVANGASRAVRDFPAVYYAPADGGRVVVAGAAGGPEGLPGEERYYRLWLADPEATALRFVEGDAHRVFAVTVEWPYRLPNGEEAAAANRRTFRFPVAVVAGDPLG